MTDKSNDWGSIFDPNRSTPTAISIPEPSTLPEHPQDWGAALPTQPKIEPMDWGSALTPPKPMIGGMSVPEAKDPWDDQNIIEDAKSLYSGAKTFLSQFPSIITDVIPMTVGQSLAGSDADLDDSGWLDSWINENQRERDRQANLTPEERERTWFKVPFTNEKVTFGDAEESANSLGYSVVNMITAMFAKKAAGLAGTAVGGPAVGKAAGLVGGMAGGMFISHRATKYQFVEDVQQAWMKARGITQDNITPENEAAWSEFRDDIDHDATMIGLWEAGPETFGNMFTWGIMKAGKGKLMAPAIAKIKKEIAKKITSKIGRQIAKMSVKAGIPVAKLAAVLTEEEITEAITIHEQSKYEAKHGLRDRPLNWPESFKAVLPMVSITAPFMAIGAGAVNRATELAQKIGKDAPLKNANPEIDPSKTPSPVKTKVDAREMLELAAERAAAEVAESELQAIPEQPVAPPSIPAPAPAAQEGTGYFDQTATEGEISGDDVNRHKRESRLGYTEPSEDWKLSKMTDEIWPGKEKKPWPEAVNEDDIDGIADVVMDTPTEDVEMTPYKDLVESRQMSIAQAKEEHEDTYMSRPESRPDWASRAKLVEDVQNEYQLRFNTQLRAEQDIAFRENMGEKVEQSSQAVQSYRTFLDEESLKINDGVKHSDIYGDDFVTQVPTKDLSRIQRLWRSIARGLYARDVFYVKYNQAVKDGLDQTLADKKGARMSGTGSIIIVIGDEVRGTGTLFHELTHDMQRVAPEMWEKIYNFILDNADTASLKAEVETIKGYYGDNLQVMKDELVSTFVGDLMKRGDAQEALLTKLQLQDPTAFEKFVRYLIQSMTKLRNFLKNNSDAESRILMKDVDGAINFITSMLANYQTTAKKGPAHGMTTKKAEGPSMSNEPVFDIQATKKKEVKYFSQMNKYLESVLPGKGGPKQYAALLNKWNEKGEFKTEELEWSGLIDWLNNPKLREDLNASPEWKRLSLHIQSAVEFENKEDEQRLRAKRDKLDQPKPSEVITKKQVMTYLKENEVTIDEVHKVDAGKEEFDLPKAVEDRMRLITKIEHSLPLHNITLERSEDGNYSYFTIESTGEIVETDHETGIALQDLGASEAYADNIMKDIRDLQRLDQKIRDVQGPTDRETQDFQESNILRLQETLRETHNMTAMVEDTDPDGRWGAPGHMQVDHLIGRSGDTIAFPPQGTPAMGLIDQINDTYDRMYKARRHGTQVEPAVYGPSNSNTSKLNLSGGEGYSELLLLLPKVTPKFIHGHWKGAENVVAMVRYDFRVVDGKKVLLIQELQSDWHQKGRKHGYIGEGKGKLKAADKALKAFKTKMADKKISEWTDEEGKEFNALNDIYHAQLKLRERSHQVPDAPYKKTWSDLVMKRMTKMAAELGQDYIAWVPGEVIQDRYDLSNLISEVLYDPEAQIFYAYDENNIEVFNRAGQSEADIAELIGEELARKLWDEVDNFEYFKDSFEVHKDADSGKFNIIDANAETMLDTGGNATEFEHEYQAYEHLDEMFQMEADRNPPRVSGMDLRTGGEWATNLYDKKLVNRMNDIFGKKKWGKPKVFKGEVPLSDRAVGSRVLVNGGPVITHGLGRRTPRLNLTSDEMAKRIEDLLLDNRDPRALKNKLLHAAGEIDNETDYIIEWLDNALEQEYEITYDNQKTWNVLVNDEPVVPHGGGVFTRGEGESAKEYIEDLLLNSKDEELSTVYSDLNDSILSRGSQTERETWALGWLEDAIEKDVRITYTEAVQSAHFLQITDKMKEKIPGTDTPTFHIEKTPPVKVDKLKSFAELSEPTPVTSKGDAAAINLASRAIDGKQAYIESDDYGTQDIASSLGWLPAGKSKKNQALLTLSDIVKRDAWNELDADTASGLGMTNDQYENFNKMPKKEKGVILLSVFMDRRSEVGAASIGNLYEFDERIPKNADIIAGMYQASWHIDLETKRSTEKLYRKIFKQAGEQEGPAMGDKEPGEDQVKLTEYLNKSWGTYREAADATEAGDFLPVKNVLLRPKGVESGKGRQLLVQISSDFRGEGASNIGDSYYEALYNKREGYLRPSNDFWELPEWMNRMAYFLPDADIYVIRNLKEAKLFLEQAGYDNTFFSVMDINKRFVKEIADTYSGNIIAGGYLPDGSYYEGMDNVTWVGDMQGAADKLGVEFKNGVDYRYFLKAKTIPRLEMSKGCLHKCAFCSQDRFLTVSSQKDIEQQIQAYKAFDYEIVYLNDKTFGQAENYPDLVNIKEDLKKANPNFKGFVIQTTATEYLKMSDEFLTNSGIVYLEIGVETFNDKMLELLSKPHREKHILEATEKARRLKQVFVPNIMVGLAAKQKDGSVYVETAETYARTLKYLNDNRDIISHTNIGVLAAETGTKLHEQLDALETDQDEAMTERSWLKNVDVHEKYFEQLSQFGTEQLEDPKIAAYVKESIQTNLNAPDSIEDPIEAYHGTFKDFDEFTKGDIGFHFGTKDQANARIHFEEGTDLAPGGEGRRIIPVKIRIKRPLRLDDAVKWGNVTNIEKMLIKKGLISKDKAADLRSLSDVRDFIKSLGYDGIVYDNKREGSGDSYIAFDSDQVEFALLQGKGQSLSELQDIVPDGIKVDALGEEGTTTPAGWMQVTVHDKKSPAHGGTFNIKIGNKEAIAKEVDRATFEFTELRKGLVGDLRDRVDAQDVEATVEGDRQSPSYRYAYYGIFNIAKAARGMGKVRSYLGKLDDGDKELNGLPVTKKLVELIGNVADRLAKDKKKANKLKKIIKLRDEIASGEKMTNDPKVIKEMQKLGNVQPYSIRHTAQNFVIGQRMRYGKFPLSVALFDDDREITRETGLSFRNAITGNMESVTKQYDKEGNRLISGPIFSTDRKTRLQEIKKIVIKNKKYSTWYEDWKKFMFQFVSQNMSEMKIKRIAAISGMLGAGKSPQTQQQIWTETINSLESGHRPTKVAKNEMDKMMEIWDGKKDDILSRTDDEGIKLIQEEFGRKIGPYLAAAIDPSSPNVLVLDRHMPKGWGYNVLATSNSPQGGWNMNPSVETEVRRDILEVADDMGVSVAGVQAALWFDFRTPAADQSDISKIAQIEPSRFVPNVFHRTTNPGLTTGIHYKKTDIKEGDFVQGSKVRGKKFNTYSMTDIGTRIERATKEWPYQSAVYMYQPGGKQEPQIQTGRKAYSFKYDPSTIYDGVNDPYNYWGTAKDELAKSPEASLTNIFLKLIKSRQQYQGAVVRSPYNPQEDQWMMIFDEAEVTDFPEKTSVGISDMVDDIDTQYSDFESATKDMKARGYFFGKFAKSLKDSKKYNEMVFDRYYPSVARFEGITSGEIELGLGLGLGGPLRTQRAFLSEVGISRAQRQVYLAHSPRDEMNYPDFTEFSEAKLFMFKAKNEYSDDIVKLAKDLKKAGLTDFNVILSPAGWPIIQQITFNDTGATQMANIVEKFADKGHPHNQVRDIHSETLGGDTAEEALVNYSSAIIDYWGEKKGREIIDAAIKEGEKFTGEVRSGAYQKRVADKRAGRPGKKRNGGLADDAEFGKPTEDVEESKDNLKTDATVDAQLDRIGRTKIGTIEKIRKSANYETGTFTTATADKLHPLKMAAGAKSEAYMLHRGLPGIQSSINAMMEHGVLHLEESGVLTTSTKNEGFIPWIRDLGKDGEKFFYWLIAKRDQSREKRDKKYNPMFTKEERDNLFEWTGVRSSKGKNWQEVNKEFQVFNDSILKLGIDSGLLDPASVAQFRDQFYIPFFRIFEDAQATAEFIKAPVNTKQMISAQIKRLQGTRRQMGDPLENIMMNWSHLIKQSMTNQARKSAFNALNDDIVNELGDKVVEEVPWKDTVIFKPGGKKLNKSGGEDTVTFIYQKDNTEVLGFKDNGKTRFFKVNDAELFTAMSLQSTRNLPKWLAIMLGAPKALLTFGATIMPGFVVANTMRDTLHTYTIAEGFIPFLSTAKGLYKTLAKDQDYVEYMASGNSFVGSYVKAESAEQFNKYTKKLIKKEGRGVLKRILTSPKMLWDFWRTITEASENAARLALYSSMKRRGSTKLEASFAARDIMDFQKKGASAVVQYLTATVPFLNARIQGLWKMGEAAAERPGVYALKGASIAIASLALWAAFKDDERYIELEDWEKFAYYHFWVGDMHFRIPKPFETGVVWSSAFTVAADVVTGNEEAKHIMAFIGDATLNTFAFNPIPQAVKPIAEQYFNKSMFTGRAIEPESMKYKAPEDRYSPWDHESLIALAKVLKVSPKRADALVRGYLAGLGTSVLAGADIMVRQFGDFPARPSSKLDDYPFIGRFVRETPARYTKFQTKFYDIFEELNQLSQMIKIAARDGRHVKAAELRKLNSKKLLAFGRGKIVKQKLAVIRKKVTNIWSDRVMDPGEKKKRLSGLAVERGKVVKEFYDWYLDDK